MQRDNFMKEATANSIGNTLLGGTVITSATAASVESLSWIQSYYSELMFGLAFAGLIIGGLSKYYAHQLNKKRFEHKKGK